MKTADSLRFASTLISSSARGYAAFAATTLLERHPEAAAGMGPEPFRAWSEHLTARLAELSAAVGVESPELFAREVAWTRSALSARGLPVESVGLALGVLRETLEAELPDSAREIVGPYFDGAAAALAGEAEEASPVIDASTPEGRTAAEFIRHILEGERTQASRAVLGAVERGLAPEGVYTGVLIPAMLEIGRLWHLGELNVAEEHFASGVMRAVISQLSPLLPRKARHGKTVITASVQGNFHDLAVLVLADLFEMEGWRSINLGADTPAEDLVLSVAEYGADLLVLSATLAGHLRTAVEMIRTLRAAPESAHVPILIGGRALEHAPRAWRRIGADASASSFDDAVREGARLAGLMGS